MVASISQISKKTFDYIIVGGGTAGLVLANRLSADPSVSVAVLEAGEAHADDPNVLAPTLYGGQLFNDKYDWTFFTTEQKHSNNVKVPWNRGKGLGGSSGLNFHVWMTPPAEDIDALEKLGNPGWNWSEYSKYYKRCETFIPVAGGNNASAQIPDTRGTSGPIQVISPPEISSIDKIYHGTYIDGMGLPANDDPFGGDILGAWNIQSNIDPKTHHRSYAATGYYFPVQDRQNLTVLTEAYVTRVLLDRETETEDFRATGAEFSYKGEIHTVNCSKELILSAGTLHDPKILELSGIGRKDILDKIGVPINIELPGVGENVQDHTLYPSVYELAPDPSHKTVDLMRDPTYAANAMKLFAEGKGVPSIILSTWSYFSLSFADPAEAPALIKGVEEKVQELKLSGSLPSGLAEQYDLQLEALRNPKLPDCQANAFPGYYGQVVENDPYYKPENTYLSVMHFGNHPLSRGTIHARSKDPLEHPEIDANYFAFDLDLDVLVKTFLVTRRMSEHEPFKSGVVKEVVPGPEVDTEEKIREHIKDHVGTGFHAIGSCSMLPREKNGVVDPNLVVYGTKNLRVVDLSIVPLHFCAHTQTTAYVIGEKAADLIRGL